MIQIRSHPARGPAFVHYYGYYQQSAQSSTRIETRGRKMRLPDQTRRPGPRPRHHAITPLSLAALARGLEGRPLVQGHLSPARALHIRAHVDVKGRRASPELAVLLRRRLAPESPKAPRSRGGSGNKGGSPKIAGRQRGRYRRRRGRRRRTRREPRRSACRRPERFIWRGPPHRRERGLPERQWRDRSF